MISFPSFDFDFVQKTRCVGERAGQRFVATGCTMNFHHPHGKTTDAALWHIRKYPVFAIDSKSVWNANSHQQAERDTDPRTDCGADHLSDCDRRAETGASSA